jgi:hypothetical protein
MFYFHGLRLAYRMKRKKGFSVIELRTSYDTLRYSGGEVVQTADSFSAITGLYFLSILCHSCFGF